MSVQTADGIRQSHHKFRRNSPQKQHEYPLQSISRNAATVSGSDRMDSKKKNIGIAMSKVETIMVTGTGDALVVHCRHAPTVGGGGSLRRAVSLRSTASTSSNNSGSMRRSFPATSPATASNHHGHTSSTDDLAQQQTARMIPTSSMDEGSSLCHHCDPNDCGGKLGLLGGAAAAAPNIQDAPNIQGSNAAPTSNSTTVSTRRRILINGYDEQQEESMAAGESKQENDDDNNHDNNKTDPIYSNWQQPIPLQKSYSGSMVSTYSAAGSTSGGGLLPLPSFDYSHFFDYQDGNDMIPCTTPEQDLLYERGVRMSLNSSLRLMPTSIPESGNNAENEKEENVLLPIDSNSRGTHRAQPSGMSNHATPKTSSKQPNADMGSSSSQNFKSAFTSNNSDYCNKIKKRGVLVRPLFLHGVPTFLSNLSQIRVTQISAHPLGSHVLLISAEALLFSFGLNDHGQLGHGRKSSVGDANFGYLGAPIIVTPLLEHGGKTILCAAGVDHSLVVVKTDGRRVGRATSSSSLSRSNSSVVGDNPQQQEGRASTDGNHDNTASPTSSRPTLSRQRSASEYMQNHQVYGFGNNEHNKLGLVNPPSSSGGASGGNSGVSSSSKHKSAYHHATQDVLLPRRVALHCKVYPGTTSSNTTNTSGFQEEDGLPPAGIFDLAASVHHSAALVRRGSGAVELYTWGKASEGALGFLPSSSGGSGSNRRDASSSPSSRSPRKSSSRKYSTEGSKSSSKSSTNKKVGRLHHLVVPMPTLVENLSYSPTLSKNSAHPPRHHHGRKHSSRGNSPVPVPVAPSLSSSSSSSSAPSPPPPPFSSPLQFSGETSPGISNTGKRSKSHSPEYPVRVRLGKSCTFLLTNTGTCRVVGASRDGMLGLGAGITHTNTPQTLEFSKCEDEFEETELSSPPKIESISIGARHVVAVTRDGSAYTWGCNANKRLGLGRSSSRPASESSSSYGRGGESNDWRNESIYSEQNAGSDAAGESSKEDIRWTPQLVCCPIYDNTSASNDNGIASSSTGNSGGRRVSLASPTSSEGKLSVDVSSPSISNSGGRRVSLASPMSLRGKKPLDVSSPSIKNRRVSVASPMSLRGNRALLDIHDVAESISSKNDFHSDQTNSNIAAAKGAAQIVQACAGYDCTAFVTADGAVLSCGKSSGRLGHGEVMKDVAVPSPMFGGLHLWQPEDRSSTGARYSTAFGLTTIDP